MGFNRFETHETLEALEFYFENNIILCRLPSPHLPDLANKDESMFRLKGLRHRDLLVTRRSTILCRIRLRLYPCVRTSRSVHSRLVQM